MFFIKKNIEEASLENIRLSSIPTKLNFKTDRSKQLAI
jgi:hypothetical protein